MTPTRIVVAMSGGVDSSVAAALLVERGYKVIGLMLRLWSEADNAGRPANRCCSLDAQYEAERVADQLDIPFYIVNVASAFKRRVVDYFISEYIAGRTPNPCIQCNRQIRFDVMLRRALALEAQYLATGHYARVRRENDHYQLLRGVDARKDQSYVLHILDQTQLAHACFPVGEYTKSEVREMARRFELPVAERDESQDLCFVSDGDYRRFLSERAPQAVRPGPICDSSGRLLGQHRGLAHYTIGQRKGIGISAPEPLYVLRVEPQKNTLIVGTAAELGRDECTAHSVNWIAGEPAAQEFKATAKIRYKAPDTAVSVKIISEQTVRVHFDQPMRDITPGQAIVFYQGERVLGGATIAQRNGLKE